MLLFYVMGKKLVKFSAMSINQRIVLLRHSLKLTQKEFAKKVFLSTSFLASIEIEQKKVLDRHIKLIISAFGVNEAWLRTGEGEIFEKDSTPNYKIAETLEIFKQLNPFFQDFILGQMNKLLEYERAAKKEDKKSTSGSQC